MKPDPRKRAVVVGTFTAIGLVILAAGILTIGNLRDTFSRKIGISAVFPDVNGLQPGDNVWCSGLKVGAVKALSFSETSQVRVEMVLQESVLEFIHTDTKAHLGSDGLIGNPIVILDGGSPDAPILFDGSVLEVETTVSTGDVLAMLQENNENLLAITSDIREVTGKVRAGEGTVGRLLAEDDLYEQVTSAVAALDTASDNARRLTSSLATFSAKLNTEGNLANDLVTDSELRESVSASVASLQAATARAQDLVDQLGTNLADPDAPVGALLTDEKLADDLKTTMDRLTTGTALLNEDLKAIQSNFLFRPYFRKQEREAKKAAREKEKAAQGR